MNPPPTADALADLYSRSGHGLDAPAKLSDLLEAERDFPNSTADASRIIATATHLDESATNRAIDVGAGYGFYTKALVELGYDTTSLNPGEYENAAFRELVGHDPLPTMFNDFVPDQPFGIVLMSQVLEHIPDPVATVTKVADVLAARGVFACAVPNFRSWRVRLLGVRDNSCLWVPEHVNYFTLRGLELLFDRVGLNVKDYQFTTRVFPDAVTRRLPWLPERPVASAIRVAQQPFCRAIDRRGAGSYMTAYGVKVS
jgi:SAM-dependent methyltransferase